MANPKKTLSPDYVRFKDRLLADNSGLTEGALFGMDCLKVGKKAFVGSFDGGLVVRLDETDAAKALTVKDAQGFDPSGRGKPMKGWIVLPASAKRRWKGFAQLALELAKAQ